MGRWDYLVERKPQPLKEYVLDQVAERLARELMAWPPAIDEWLDEPLRQRFRAAIERPSAPGLDTLRVGCEIARRELVLLVEKVEERLLRGQRFRL